jgi:restriction system protein
MAIPDYQAVMLPLLKFTADQQEHSIRQAVEALANTFQLSDKERAELLPSGQQSVFDNRVNWAVSYLKHAGLLERTRRGVYRITPRGIQVIKQSPPRIDVRLLTQYPEFIAFKESSRRDRNGQPQAEQLEQASQQTPEELLEYGYQRIRQELAQELLARIKVCSPSFFERLVVELLVKMGYGGSRKDAGEAVGRSGDEGIDGIIKEDRLGLRYHLHSGQEMARCSGQARDSQICWGLTWAEGTQRHLHYDLGVHAGRPRVCSQHR